MKFWDSSALVPLIVMERETDYGRPRDDRLVFEQS
jgi:hypothetical protein